MKIETVTYKRLMPQCAVHLRTNRLIKNASVSHTWFQRSTNLQSYTFQGQQVILTDF